MQSVIWQEARRVLAIRLDAIGDLVMTGPAIRALKEGRPDRHVTLLTSSSAAAMAPLLPGIDAIIGYDPPWMKATPPRSCPQPDLQMIERLKTGGFDACVIFTVFSQNPLPAALMAYLAGIPLRLAHSRENPYQLLSDWIKEREPDQGIRHEVRRQLDLVAAVGCTTSNERLQLIIPESARLKAADLLARPAAPGPLILVHPGSTAASRRWPAARFGQAAEQIRQVTGGRIIVVGSQAEEPLCQEVAAGMAAPPEIWAGQLDLASLAALIAEADLLLCNNSGPAHLAAAVATPVVTLYALTNPQHTPWQTPARVLNSEVPCRWCFKSVCPQGHHACLLEVSAEQVVQAALELLQETSEARPIITMKQLAC